VRGSTGFQIEYDALGRAGRSSDHPEAGASLRQRVLYLRPDNTVRDTEILNVATGAVRRRCARTTQRPRARLQRIQWQRPDAATDAECPWHDADNRKRWKRRTTASRRPSTSAPSTTTSATALASRRNHRSGDRGGT
jgi:hypothetical protein